ncbi:MAG TPA: hemolysin family protein [Acidimicrobiales bacterium]|nr:hemolysin family protein [Acidimicrobiales bacterium]
MSVVVPIAVVFVMVAFNALYVTAEFATVGSRRSRVQETAEAGNGAAVRLLAILRDPARLDNYVAACQIGITLSSLVAGAYGQAQLTPLLEPVFGAGGRAVAVLIVLVAITALQVVLGELLPKTAALRYPERLAMLTLAPMRISQWLFHPLVVVFNGSAFALMRWWKLSVDHSHAHVHSPEELAGLYRASAAGGLIDASERDMLAGVLNVEDRLVREIMTPRRRLVTVRGSQTVSDALRRLAPSPHSRFPVVDDADEIVGIVHVRDLFARAQTDPMRTVSDVARPALAVAEVLTVPRLWRSLHDEEQHCAVVVNEYGWVAGMVTLEDALEEIFGEVHDEFDDDVEPIVVVAGRVSVRGDVLVDVLNDRFGLAIDPDDADTVSGLLWHELGRLPETGDEVRLVPSGVVVRVDLLDDRTVGRASFDLPGGAE